MARSDELTTYIKLDGSKEDGTRYVTPKYITLLKFMQGAGEILCFEPPSYELVGSDGALIRHVSELKQNETLVIRKRPAYGRHAERLRQSAALTFSRASSDSERVEAAAQLLTMPQEMFQLILKTSQRNSHSMTPWELAKLIDQAGGSTYVFMDTEQSSKLIKCFSFEGQNWKYYHVIGARTIQFWRLAGNDTFGGTIAHCYYGSSRCNRSNASTLRKESLEETTIELLTELIRFPTERFEESYFLNYHLVASNLLRKALL